MIRINDETAIEVLTDIKAGDFVTDTFSKSGIVESVEITDDGLYRFFTIHLVTGRTITTKR